MPSSTCICCESGVMSMHMQREENRKYIEAQNNHDSNKSTEYKNLDDENIMDISNVKREGSRSETDDEYDEEYDFEQDIFEPMVDIKTPSGNAKAESSRKKKHKRNVSKTCNKKTPNTRGNSKGKQEKKKLKSTKNTTQQLSTSPWHRAKEKENVSVRDRGILLGISRDTTGEKRGLSLRNPGDDADSLVFQTLSSPATIVDNSNGKSTSYLDIVKKASRVSSCNDNSGTSSKGRSKLKYMRNELDILFERIDVLNDTINTMQLKDDIRIVNIKQIRFFEQIGSGGSEANVYRCKIDGWRCVCKMLNTRLSSPRTLDAFNEEIRIFYNLPRHENVIRYLFDKYMDGKLCLFMSEYDSTLREYIESYAEQNQYLEYNDIVTICLNVCNGMIFLHEHGIMHRDLKSGNVFISFNSNSIVEVVVADFDVSKQLFCGTRSETRPRSVIGTPGFMAPEVIDSNEESPYTTKVDVFSFGMFMYELLTLRYPYYEERNTYTISNLILEGKRPTISEDIKKRYKNLVQIHIMCTRKDPAKRPSFAKIFSMLSSQEH